MRELWDSRYGGEEFHFGEHPNAFLVTCREYLSAGQKALAVADGEGRNGVWLAKLGLEVHSVDFSPVAQAKAKKLAGGLPLKFELADLFSWQWPRESFDVVAAIFIQFAPPGKREKMFADIKRALKPGGILLLEGYTPKQLEYKTGGPSSVENLYTRALLEKEFADMEILLLDEREEVIEEGEGHRGMSALIDLVARKP